MKIKRLSMLGTAAVGLFSGTAALAKVCNCEIIGSAQLLVNDGPGAGTALSGDACAYNQGGDLKIEVSESRLCYEFDGGVFRGPGNGDGYDIHRFDNCYSDIGPANWTFFTADVSC